MGISDNIWAQWKLEENGLYRYDSSGNGRTLTYVPIIDPDYNFPPDRISGKIGYGVRINENQGGYVTKQGTFIYTVPTTYSGMPFTMAVWVKQAEIQLNITRASVVTGFNTGAYGFAFNSHNTNKFVSCTFSVETRAITTSFNIVPDTWHLYVAYGDGNSIWLDIDGVNVGSHIGSTKYTLVLNDTICLGLGAHVTGVAPTNWVDIDEFTIWTSMLSSSERKSLWNDGDGFDTIGTGGMYGNTLLYADDLMEGRRGWFFDTYTPTINVHYGEEGSSVHSILCGGKNGGIYQLTGDSDAGSAVACKVTTASRDQGDTRHNKLYGDIMLDCNTGGVDITATPGFNNDSVASAAVTVNNAVRSQVPISVGTEWQTARNISLDLQWNMNGTRSYLYIWEPRYTEEGGKVFAYDWETRFLTHEMPGYFYHGYLYLVHISSADLTFTITDEDGTVKTTTTIPNSAGLHSKSFIRLPVIKGKLFKYRLSSTAVFRVEGQDSELLVKAWGQGGPWSHQKIFQDVPHGEAA